MPGPITIYDNGLLEKDPADSSVYAFDWDLQHLAAGVQIITSTFTIVEQVPILAWDILTDYIAGDRVFVATSIYTCILAHVGFTPPDAIYWAVSGTSVVLTKDNESKLTAAQATIALRHTVTLDDRATQLRLIGGTEGQQYRIDNKIVSNETPAQTKERSFFVLVQD